jgi:hypothetical protein
MFRREIVALTTLTHRSILKLLGDAKQPPFCLVTVFQFLRAPVALGAARAGELSRGGIANAQKHIWPSPANLGE